MPEGIHSQYRFVAILFGYASIGFFSILCPQSLVFGYFSSDTINETPHPLVESFWKDGNGVWQGTTVDGSTFLQYPVPNEYGLHIERFVIDEYAHYIVDGAILYSLSELTEWVRVNQSAATKGVYTYENSLHD